METTTFKQRVGQCYRLAGSYVIDHGGTLVHGTINGRKWGLADLDNPHAWVELEDGMIFDAVLGSMFDADSYYVVFQATPLKRYTSDRVRELTLETEHWGPWKEEVQDECGVHHETTDRAG